MSTDLTLTRPAGANLPAAFKNAKAATVFQNNTSLETGSEGIEGSYPIIKFAGKVWSLQYRGENRKFMRPDGDGARGSIDAIFIRMATNKAKTLYPPGFTEGSKEKPTCWSNDGARPDPAVPPSQKQAPACAACPKNVFGSRVTDDGKQAKACGDHKRTAVVLDPAMVMALLGIPLAEPCLLRIPAASLNDFSTFADTMKAQGFPLQSFVTKISFDTTKNYPKFKFEAVKPLGEEEGAIVMAYRDDVVAHRIVSDSAMTAVDGVEDANPGADQAGTTVGVDAGPNLGARTQPQGTQSSVTTIDTGPAPNVVPLNVAPRAEALNPNPPRNVAGPTSVQEVRPTPAQQALQMAREAADKAKAEMAKLEAQAALEAAQAQKSQDIEKPPLEMQTQDVAEREVQPNPGGETSAFDDDINAQINKLLG